MSATNSLRGSRTGSLMMAPSAAPHAAVHQGQHITASNVSDSGNLIFGLYPPHAANLRQQQQHQAPQLGPESVAAATVDGNNINNARSDKKVFYEQPDGHFADAQREAQLRQDRIRAQAQLNMLRSQIPEWSPDDDAKTFAPFFLHLVFAMTHIRRMLTGCGAGFSLLILIAIYWAPSLAGVSIDTNTKQTLPNSTIGGAFGALCRNETMSDCSSIVAYSTIYKATSYFFLLVSLLGTFLSLVPFTFDLALQNARSHIPAAAALSQQHLAMTGGGGGLLSGANAAANATTGGNSGANPPPGQQQPQQHQQQQQYAANGGVGIGHVTTPGLAQTTTTVVPTGPPVAAPILYMVLRHLIASTFPLFFVSLVCCMAMSRVELDRRMPARMVAIDAAQVATLRTGIILRSVCLILAWLFSFRFKEASPSDEILNAAAVIDLRS